MFSSNQILKISGSLSDVDTLKKALLFALELEGSIEHFTREKDAASCVFQITKDGKYCIGKIWGYNQEVHTAEEWSEYPFDFDVDIISKIIKQHLDKQKIEYTDGDGSHGKGFLMKHIPLSFAEETDGLIKPYYGVVSFEPYTCFYHK